MSERRLFRSVLRVLVFKSVVLAVLWFTLIRPNVVAVDAASTAAALGFSNHSPKTEEGVVHGQ
jgi:hypothetical protein